MTNDEGKILTLILLCLTRLRIVNSHLHAAFQDSTFQFPSQSDHPDFLISGFPQFILPLHDDLLRSSMQTD